MKAAIAVHGRFHAFELAGCLHANGMLAQLATTYPAFIARRFLPAGTPLATAPWLEMVRRAHGWTGFGPPPDFFIASSFGRFAVRHLPAADVFVGWSGASLEAIAEAKRRGMRTVLERGSTHIVAQDEILREAYARRGIARRPVDPRIIEREVSEYESADLIVVGSAHARNSFIAKGVSPDRIAVNPYGVDLKRFSPRRAPAPRGPGGIVLFVGEIGVRKGVPWLLQAFAGLPPDWELHLVGPLAPGFGEVLARLPMDRVVLRGVLSRDELAMAYREADIFCLPSIEEGFGMVILQAMASGLPVVASTATGGPDAGEDGRDLLLVPPGDAKALGSALARLAGGADLRATIGAAAGARVSSGFSWDDYGRRAIGILRGVVGGANR